MRTLEECLFPWIYDKSESDFKALIYFIIWVIGLSRNNVIFQGLDMSPTQVAQKIRVSSNWSWQVPK
jgi:hypothetical protein